MGIMKINNNEDHDECVEGDVLIILIMVINLYSKGDEGTGFPECVTRS